MINEGKKRIGQVPFFKHEGYMYYKFPSGMKAHKEYTFTYNDFNGENLQDFTIHVYGE